MGVDTPMQQTSCPWGKKAINCSCMHCITCDISHTESHAISRDIGHTEHEGIIQVQ